MRSFPSKRLVPLPAIALILFAPAAASARPLESLSVCSATIDVEFTGPTPELPTTAFLDWITQGAVAVGRYFGRFPTSHLHLTIITTGEGQGVQGGTTWGWNGAYSEIRIGRRVTRAELDQNWVMTHEMVHLAIPDTGDDFQWIQEGAATYIEPLARSFVGRYPIPKVWSDLVDGFPNGIPTRGLDNTESWGNTYWGGAFFYARADIEIRRRTGNRLGLIDALRGVLAAGGNHEHRWTPDRIFAAGDKAVGVDVLEELWHEMSRKPVNPNLPAMWRALGVPGHADGVANRFDDAAPDAAIRKAIERAPSGPACAASAK